LTAASNSSPRKGGVRADNWAFFLVLWLEARARQRVEEPNERSNQSSALG
jgi:hypothetical protein